MRLSSESREIALSLPARPEAVTRMRHALLEAGLDPDLDHTVSLLATAVFTNSVRHAPGPSPIRLTATFAHGWARVVVSDAGPGFDPEARHTAGGFGLRLLDKLATDWGVEHADGLNQVWFEVDRRRRRFERPDADAS